MAKCMLQLFSSPLSFHTEPSGSEPHTASCDGKESGSFLPGARYNTLGRFLVQTLNLHGGKSGAGGRVSPRRSRAPCPFKVVGKRLWNGLPIPQFSRVRSVPPDSNRSPFTGVISADFFAASICHEGGSCGTAHACCGARSQLVHIHIISRHNHPSTTLSHTLFLRCVPRPERPILVVFIVFSTFSSSRVTQSHQSPPPRPHSELFCLFFPLSLPLRPAVITGTPGIPLLGGRVRAKPGQKECPRNLYTMWAPHVVRCNQPCRSMA